MALFLDTGVLGYVTHPRAEVAAPCHQWLMECVAAGSMICVPEIADYELRRSLIRISSQNSINKLNSLSQDVAQYVPLTTDIMREAARFWAQMRQQQMPMAPPDALDGDVILAAQALGFAASAGQTVIVVTTNVGDLSRLTDARRWEDIPVGRY
jgi:predicted nucleic acid-binding protein